MRYTPLALAVLVVVGAGVVHGLRTDRWGSAKALDAAAARLGDVPMKLGDWESKTIEVDARQLAVAEAVGHLARRYVNRRTGDEFTVVVLCGRPGPISVHTPDVCYSGAGFNAVGASENFSLPAGAGLPSAEFFKGRFVKPGPVPEALDVLWAWTTDGSWIASTSPRVAFARSPVLYKLYVIRRLTRPDEKPPPEPCQDFLHLFLPALDARISPTS